MTLRSFKPSVLCEKERKNVLVKERERDNEKEKESKRFSVEMQKNIKTQGILVKDRE